MQKTRLKSRRSKLRINTDWAFHLGDTPEASKSNFDHSSWEQVTIPHTLKLTSLSLDDCQDDKTQPTFHRHIGWYRREIFIGGDQEQNVFLEFEGAHQVTELWVNGTYVGKHGIGGYTPFHFDITEFVNWEKTNTIALRLDNTVNPEVPPDPGPFDYIKFSGLYRDLYLVKTNRLHIPFPWESLQSGVRITTPSVSEHFATIDIKTCVRNSSDTAQSTVLESIVVDADGIVVRKLKSYAVIEAHGTHMFSQVDGIEENLQLWSCENPYLYSVLSVVRDDAGVIIDLQENPLGIRKFELRDGEGFFLNGTYLKLIGVNRHQHFPYIGDAVPKSLHRKDALQFKKAGFNVVRLAHYPHNNAFIEACDELGLLVYEEAPTWINLGNEAWQENLVTALRRAIRNHRNHPSIFAWGGGVNHRGPLNSLHFAAKEEDPTRWTASNHSPWTGSQASDYTDFISNMDYRDIPDPTEPMFASEHGISTDGTRAMTLVSRYNGDPQRFGMAAWTAHAYYTFHPAQEDQIYRTRGGMMDIFRIPKPVYHWYISELTSEPMVYVVDEWSEGITELHVFSNCDEIELHINGVSSGRHSPDSFPEYKNLNHPPFTVPVWWEEGELIVSGLIGGTCAVKETLMSPKTPERINVKVDLENRSFEADGSDIVQAFASIVDANDSVISNYTGHVEFQIEGSAEIIGGTEIGSNPMECFNGVAPVLLKASTEAGEINLSVSSGDLVPGAVTFQSAPPQGNEQMEHVTAIYDLPRVKLDIGGEGQHVQYGWLPWIGANGPSSSFDLPQFSDDAVAALSGVQGSPLRWRGESNVPGPLGFMAEDGVCSATGLTLEISGLADGTYTLTTYHHAPHSDTDSMDPLANKQHDIDITKMPPAHFLSAMLHDTSEQEGVVIHQTSGKRIESSGPGSGDVIFTIAGAESVFIEYLSKVGQGSVWINGIDLRMLPG